MKNFKNFFQKVSYLQYPIVLFGVFFMLRPFLLYFQTMEMESFMNLDDFNKGLILFGLSISFSTLQDTTKTQNKFSKDVWSNPKKSKIMLSLMGVNTLLYMVLGATGLFLLPDSKLQEIALGFLVLGIGMMGMLRSAMEMASHHQGLSK